MVPHLIAWFAKHARWLPFYPAPGPGGTGDPLPLCSVAAQEQYGATPRRPGLPAARTTTLAGGLSEVTT